MQPKRAAFTVTLDLPAGATLEGARSYIEDAVTTWCGSLFPGTEEDEADPFFSLDRKSVKVTVR